MTQFKQDALLLVMALLSMMTQGCVVLRKEYYVDGVQGRIVDENKKPVASAKVKIEWWYETSKRGGESRKIKQNAVTNFDGYFVARPYWKYKWESIYAPVGLFFGGGKSYTKRDWMGMYVKARGFPEQMPYFHPFAQGASMHKDNYYILAEDIVVYRQFVEKEKSRKE